MTFNDRLQLLPLLRVAMFFVVGILIGRLFASVALPVWIICCTVVLLLAWMLGKFPRLQSLLILVTFTFSGALLMRLVEQSFVVALPDGETEYEAVVISQPIERGRVVRFDMLISKGTLAGQKVRATLLRDTVQQHYRRLRPGMGIKALSRFEYPRNFENSHFDYITYLKCQGIGVQTFIYHSHWRLARVSLLSLSRWQRFRITLLSWRSAILARYRQTGLEGDAAAVVAAMTLGERSSITTALRDVYQQTGVSHALALSGMHLSVFTMLFVGVARRRFRMLRCALFLFAIWTYVVMVGMMPSVVRAALMSSVYVLLSIARRNALSLNVLAFAAILMLVSNPFILFDVGFQLSFVSVAFILVYAPLVSAWVPQAFQLRFPLLRWFWQLVVLSFSAQLGTAPLVALYFGRLPLYFLFTNLLVVPAVALVIYLSLFLLLTAGIPILSSFSVQMLTALVAVLHGALVFFTSLPHASIPVYINGVQAMLLYVVIGAFSVFFYILFRRHR